MASALVVIRDFMHDEVNDGKAYARDLLKRLKAAGVAVVNPIKPQAKEENSQRAARAYGALILNTGFEQEVKKQLIGKDAHVEVSRYEFVPVENPDSLRLEILCAGIEGDRFALLVEDQEFAGDSSARISCYLDFRRRNRQGIGLKGREQENSRQKSRDDRERAEVGEYPLHGLEIGCSAVR